MSSSGYEGCYKLARSLCTQFYVFPIAINWDIEKQGTSKKPLNNNGHLNATRDVKALDEQFQQARTRIRTAEGDEWGVGICPGLSGQFVVDVDKHKDGGNGFASVLTWLAEDYELPRTRVIRSASGGFHLWYDKHSTTATVGNAQNLVPGIDIRGDDGWVVAPGVTTTWGTWSEVGWDEWTSQLHQNG